MEKCIIAAVSDNNAIGKDNALLWHISDDLKYFKKVTLGRPVIMGRKTYESIGRPLPKRLNIVVTGGSGEGFPEGVLAAGSLDEAYSLAGRHIEETEDGEGGKCFVTGGGRIYAQAIDGADKLYITQVHTIVYDADTFFPAIDPEKWKVEERSGMMKDPENGYEYEFIIYRRTYY